MKINRVQINNFGGIKQADIELRKLNLFFGENRAGKSSIIHAVAYPFLGTCVERGYKNRKAGASMATGSNMSVTITVDAVEYTRAPSTGKVVGPCDHDVFAAVMNATQLLTAPAADIQGLFGRLSVGGQSGEIKTFLEHAGYNGEIIKMVEKDIDVALDWATEQRRQAKRDIKGAEARLQEVLSVVTIDGKQLDLVKQTPAVVNAGIAQLQKQRDTLIAAGEIDVDALLQEQAELKKSLHALDDSVLENTLAENTAAFSRAKTEREKAYKDMLGAQAKAEQPEWEQIAFLELAGLCPTCKAIMVDRRDNAKQQRKANAKSLTQNAEVAKQRHINAAHNESELQITLKELRENKAKSELLKREGENHLAKVESDLLEVAESSKSPTERIDNIDTRLAKYQELLAASTAYQVQLGSRDLAQVGIKMGTKQRDNMDALVKLLEPAGEVRKLANAGIAACPWDADLLEAWTLQSLTLQPDGIITLHDEPIAVASVSEKYMCTLLILERLSRATGLGLLMLDGLEVLESKTRMALSTVFNQWAEDYETIICAASVVERPEVKSNGERAVFWVQDGTVEQI